MDEAHFELAALLEQLQRERGIKAAADAAAKARTPPPDFDGTCVTCGGEIPAERLANGYFRCTICVEQDERRARQGR